MTAADLAASLDARRSGDGWTARCPAHQDDRASLSIAAGDDGRVLLHCHAGCTTENIVMAMGVTLADLFPPRDAAGTSEPEAVYDYRDEAGVLLFQVVRFGGKKFRQRRPDGSGGWIWKLDDTRRVLYRLPGLAGKEAVILVEGEKDVEALRAIGLPATTNPHGAGKWRPEYARQLVAAGCKRVAVLPDNDPPGEAHTRTAARSCHDAGLFVKVLPLPGLPPKGDVTDWVRAGHTKAELLDLVKAAPPFDPGRPVAAGFKLELTSLADLLNEPDETVEWLVEDRIPSGAVVLLAGKPKAGKSTLARGLAYALVTGLPWLGWRTSYGPVWYLAFEDKRSEVRRHFRQLGATGREPLRLFFDQAGPDLLPALHELAKRERPAAIIVDTLQRLIHVKDMNDYAQVTESCAPILALARETGATLILVHHANKFGEGLDSILGSTGLAGSVDNVLLVGRSDRYRTLSSIQRIGHDLEPVVIALNEQTGAIGRLGSKHEADVADAATRILEALTDTSEPVTETWIKGQVDGRQQDNVRALRLLVGRGEVIRSGRGGKGDAFRYRRVAGICASTPHMCAPDTQLVGSRGSAIFDSGSQQAGTYKRSMNPALNLDFQDSGSQVPYTYVREPTNVVDFVPRSQDSGSQVPGTSQNSTFHDAETSIRARQIDSDSGSRDSAWSVEPDDGDIL